MAKDSRRTYEPKHVRLYANIMNTEAWKHLSGNSVKVLLALVVRDNSTLNGKISFSVREAAEAGNIAINTASRCLQELQDLGFIARTEKGAFSRKVSHASLWRYTWQPAPGCRPAGPTRDFEKWRPDEKTRTQKLTSAVSKIETGNANKAATVSKINTAPPEEPQNCVGEPISNIDTHIVYHRDSDSEPDQQQPKQAHPVAAAPLGHSGTTPVKVTGWDGDPADVLAAKIAAGGKSGERWAAMPKEKALQKIWAERHRREREQSIMERRRT